MLAHLGGPFVERLLGAGLPQESGRLKRECCFGLGGPGGLNPRPSFILPSCRHGGETLCRVGYSSAMATERRGPRGGASAFTPGGLRKKSFYLDEEEARALRKRAFDEERSESDLVREALRLFLGLD
jgi:hypothetical protein